MQKRLESAAFVTRVEQSTQCCHAVQDKVWVADPDGHQWEVFVVLDDAPSGESNVPNECCPTSDDEPCCTVGGEPCCAEED